jgi:hypothetical protein
MAPERTRSRSGTSTLLGALIACAGLAIVAFPHLPRLNAVTAIGTAMLVSSALHLALAWPS